MRQPVFPFRTLPARHSHAAAMITQKMPSAETAIAPAMLKRGWKRRKNTEEDTLPRLLPRHRAYLIFFSTKRHVLPKIAHIGHPFGIVQDISGIPPVGHIPIGRTDHDDLFIQKEMVHRVHGGQAAPAPHRRYGGPNLVPEHTRIRRHDDARALEESLHPCRNIGGINRGAEHYAVRLHHFGETFIEIICFYNALTLPSAPEAGLAGLKSLAMQLHEIRFNAFRLQLRKNRLDEKRSIPILAGASIDADDFHRSPRSLKSRAFQQGHRLHMAASVGTSPQAGRLSGGKPEPDGPRRGPASRGCTKRI